VASCYWERQLFSLLFGDPSVLTYLRWGKMSSLSSEHCVVVGLDEEQAPAWGCQGCARRKKKKSEAYQGRQRFWTKEAFMLANPTRTRDEWQHRTSCLSFSDTQLSGIVLVQFYFVVEGLVYSSILLKPKKCHTESYPLLLHTHTHTSINIQQPTRKRGIYLKFLKAQFPWPY